jgi:hypothetical protein
MAILKKNKRILFFPFLALIFYYIRGIVKNEFKQVKNHKMYWTLELASKLEDAPWPATKDELIDFAIRSGAPLEVIENLQEMEDEGEMYESIEDIWPDYPSKEDFFFNEDEY